MTHQAVSIRTYLLVFGALLGLLALTVAAAYLPLGGLSAIAAMTIAVAKAILIMLFFMHLVHEEGLTRVFAISGTFWLLLLFTFLLSDYLSRDNVERRQGKVAGPPPVVRHS